MNGNRSSDSLSEPHDLNDQKLRARAIGAAQGREPFDLLIVDGIVVDMITRQLRPADVGVVGSLIASVHAPGSLSEAANTISAKGQFIVPGLIDTHLHIESSMITAAAYSREVLPRGVTTVVWDPHEFGNTCGEAGMDYVLDCAAQTPLRLLLLAPSSVPSAPGYESTGADFTPEIISRLLENPRFTGVGEMMSMQAVLDGDSRFSGIAQVGLASAKRVCGHARGLSGASLNAYVAAGIETDHELTSPEDLESKLQAGLTIEMRGSHDHLLPGFVQKLNELGALPQSLTLCTDDVFVDDLAENGGLDDVLRRLVGYGMDPLSALQAATVNAAVRVHRPDLGLIAPGKRADIVLMQDLETFSATHTIVNGLVVAESGQMKIGLTEVDPPAAMLTTINPCEYSANDFKVPAEGSAVDVVVIEKPRFTEWGSRSLPVTDGYVQCADDLTRMAIINRFDSHAVPSIGYLGDWGQWQGALATTVSHDSHNLTIFGGNEEDMAVAANAVSSMGGGMAVVVDGKLLASLALPLAGLVSLQPIDSVASDFKKIREAMDSIVNWQPPFLVFKACFGASLVCNAGPRLSDVGIVDTSIGHLQTSPIGPVPVSRTGSAI